MPTLPKPGHPDARDERDVKNLKMQEAILKIFDVIESILDCYLFCIIQFSKGNR